MKPINFKDVVSVYVVTCMNTLVKICIHLCSVHIPAQSADRPFSFPRGSSGACGPVRGLAPNISLNICLCSWSLELIGLINPGIPSFAQPATTDIY